MTSTRLPSLAATAVLVLGSAGLLGLSGCGSDDEKPSSTNSSSSSSKNDTNFGDDVDDALDAVGEDGIVEITGKQLVGVFGLVDYEVVDGRLVMTSERDSDEAQSQCLQAGIVLDGVGSTAPLSIKYDDTTVNCEDFE